MTAKQPINSIEQWFRLEGARQNIRLGGDIHVRIHYVPSQLDLLKFEIANLVSEVKRYERVLNEFETQHVIELDQIEHLIEQGKMKRERYTSLTLSHSYMHQHQVDQNDLLQQQQNHQKYHESDNRVRSGADAVVERRDEKMHSAGEDDNLSNVPMCAYCSPDYYSKRRARPGMNMMSANLDTFIPTDDDSQFVIQIMDVKLSIDEILKLHSGKYKHSKIICVINCAGRENVSVLYQPFDEEDLNPDAGLLEITYDGNLEEKKTKESNKTRQSEKLKKVIQEMDDAFSFVLTKKQQMSGDLVLTLYLQNSPQKSNDMMFEDMKLGSVHINISQMLYIDELEEKKQNKKKPKKKEDEKKGNNDVIVLNDDDFEIQGGKWMNIIPTEKVAQTSEQIGSIQLSIVRQKLPPLDERSTLTVKLGIPHFGISFVDSSPREILYFSTHRLKAILEEAPSQRTFEFSVVAIQLDNQNMDAQFPVVFGPTVPYLTAYRHTKGRQGGGGVQGGSSQQKNQHSDVVSVKAKPFIQASINQTKSSIDNVYIFQYGSVLIQEFDVNVEESLIYDILTFVNEIAAKRFENENDEGDAEWEDFIQQIDTFLQSIPPSTSLLSASSFSLTSTSTSTSNPTPASAFTSSSHVAIAPIITITTEEKEKQRKGDKEDEDENENENEKKKHIVVSNMKNNENSRANHNSKYGKHDGKGGMKNTLVSKDIRFVYAIPAKSNKKFFFALLQIQPIALNLSFRPKSRVRSLFDDLQFNPFAVVLNMAGATFGSLERAPLHFNALAVENAFGGFSTLVDPIVKHMMSQALFQGYKLLGSFEFLGNPVNLIGNLGTGMRDFFYEPAQGFVTSPKAFGKGLAKGTASLLKKSVFGVFDAASKITGSLGKGVAVLTMDEEFVRSRQITSRTQPAHIGEGIVLGAKSLGTGVIKGITGVFVDPYKGAKAEGVSGFFKGVGKGVVGLITKTASGAVDMAGTALQGLHNTGNVLDFLAGEESGELTSGRVRLPRFIAGDKRLLLYNIQDALAQYIIHQVKIYEEKEKKEREPDDGSEELQFSQTLNDNKDLFIASNHRFIITPIHHFKPPFPIMIKYENLENIGNVAQSIIFVLKRATPSNFTTASIPASAPVFTSAPAKLTSVGGHHFKSPSDESLKVSFDCKTAIEAQSLVQRILKELFGGVFVQKAFYGLEHRWVDVKDKLNALIASSSIPIFTRRDEDGEFYNRMFGIDPYVSQHKYLVVEYQKGSKSTTKTFSENSPLYFI